MQGTLDFSKTYPDAPGYQKGSAPSKDGAKAIKGRSSEIARVVLGLVALAGAKGVTVDEARPQVERTMGKAMERTTVGARFTELKEAGKIVDSGQRRENPVSGVAVTVWVLP